MVAPLTIAIGTVAGIIAIAIFRRLVRSMVVLAIIAVVGAVLFLGMSGPAHSSQKICSNANVKAYLDQATPRSTFIDKTTFYQLLETTYPIYERKGIHFAGTDAIIDYWNQHPNMTDQRWLAYILATSYHETAHQMVPVREHLAKSDEAAVRIFKKYSRYQNTTYWKKNSETGHHYFGRGYVQLTWDYNYKRADKWFGIAGDGTDSFYWNPDNALDPERSVQVTYDGMVYGWFTGHCLLRYFRENRKADWVNARRIINGRDRAASIAELANSFLDMIDASEIEHPDLDPEVLARYESNRGIALLRRPGASPNGLFTAGGSSNHLYTEEPFENRAFQVLMMIKDQAVQIAITVLTWLLTAIQVTFEWIFEQGRLFVEIVSGGPIEDHEPSTCITSEGNRSC